MYPHRYRLHRVRMYPHRYRLRRVRMYPHRYRLRRVRMLRIEALHESQHKRDGTAVVTTARVKDEALEGFKDKSLEDFLSHRKT